MNYFLAITMAILLLAACSDTPDEIKSRFLMAEALDEIQASAVKVRGLGAQGIPIFLEVISSNLSSQDRLESYAKLTICINQLHELAKEGVYTKEEIPVLFSVLENQRSIADSLVTANVIEMITGIDGEYDESFVRSYTPDNEKRRKQIISSWKAKIRSNMGFGDRGIGVGPR